jgi:hypothetical protein
MRPSWVVSTHDRISGTHNLQLAAAFDELADRDLTGLVL